MYVMEDIKNALVNAGIKNKMKYNPDKLIIKLNDANICYITYKYKVRWDDEPERAIYYFRINYKITTKLTADDLETDVISVENWDKIGFSGEKYLKLNDYSKDLLAYPTEKVIEDFNDLSDIMPKTINELVEMINFYSE